MGLNNPGVPVDRELIAGAGITIDGGASATLAADVTIAATGGGGGSGGLIGRRVITAIGAGVYNASPGVGSVVIELQGGGGGGGAAASPGGTNINVGGGGSGGGYLSKRLTADFNGASYSVGSLGAGGAAGANNGANGGDTTFTTTGGAPVTYTANGGLGGGRNGPFAAPFVSSARDGGSAINGDINTPGAPGAIGVALNANNNWGGNGGASRFSGGAKSTSLGGTNVSLAGTGANGYGGGGAGAVAVGSGAAVAGGNGSAGAIIIWEYAA